MSDQHEPGHARDQRDLTPEEESHVRRLLADARHTEPMPADVGARLDRVLAGLAEEPVREAAVVRLADRRRRVTRLLVAAAAVVVVGFGGSQVIGGLGGASMDAMTGADEEPAAESAPDPGAVSGDAGGESDEGPSDQENGAPTAAQDRVAKVRPRSFATDTQALRDVARGYVTENDAQREEDNALLGFCTTGAWGAGRYVAVRYAGDPGWIVFRRPQGSTQVADLFLCGSELASRSLTLPYP